MSDQALIGDFGAPPDLPEMSDQSENGLATYRLRLAGPSDLSETLDHSKSGLTLVDTRSQRTKESEKPTSQRFVPMAGLTGPRLTQTAP